MPAALLTQVATVSETVLVTALAAQLATASGTASVSRLAMASAKLLAVVGVAGGRANSLTHGSVVKMGAAKGLRSGTFRQLTASLTLLMIAEETTKQTR